MLQSGKPAKLVFHTMHDTGLTVKHPFEPDSRFEVIAEGCFLDGYEAGAGGVQEWRRDLAVGDVLVCLGPTVKCQGWGETMVKWELEGQKLSSGDRGFQPSVTVPGLSFKLPDITKLRRLTPEPQAVPVAKRRHSPFG